MIKKNYYAIIPAFVRYDQKITANAKLLYGEITALCNEKGFCYATNKYFAELYGVSIVSISKWVNQLKEHDYIRVEMIYKKDSKEIEQRKLFLNTSYLKNVKHPIKEKLKDNNTTLYNNNTKEYSEGINTSLIHIARLFPQQVRPKTDSDLQKWKECLDKLERIEGYTPRKVYFICKKVREDDFWETNFLSLLKLRKKNKLGLKYIDVFMSKFGKELNKIDL